MIFISSTMKLIAQKIGLALLLILYFLQLSKSETVIGPESIFGVRWFLGQKFRFQQPNPHKESDSPQSHLVLMFNSQQSWNAYRFTVEIASTLFPCQSTPAVQNITSDHHETYNQVASKLGDTFTTFIHKCPVTFSSEQLLKYVSVLPYTIWASQEKQKSALFEGALRSPEYDKGEMSIAVVGDWGLLTTFSKQHTLSQPITNCLSTQISERKDLRLLLLLGDLAYDLQGRSYVNFLSYLSAFSSKIVILVTPGNHESIRHQDVYFLFKQSFYSPNWNRFYGYFDLVSLRNHVFLGYNPEHLFPWLSRTSHSSLFQVALKEEFNNFTNMFNLQFPLQTKATLRQKTIISFSHYPTYCSKKDAYEDCKKYKDLHGELTLQLQEIGVDIFLAGHVHMYERSKQLCNGQRKIRAGQEHEGVYQFWQEAGCSLFVVEGAGGNDYFVETHQAIQQQYFSEKYVGNTGFGILTLNSSNFNDLHFAHLSIAEGCWPVDEFILHVHPSVGQATAYYSPWIIIVVILVILTAIVALGKQLQAKILYLGRSKSSPTNNQIQFGQADGMHS